VPTQAMTTDSPDSAAQRASEGKGGTEHRIAFARDVLAGIQQLIQLMDQKSYLVLVIIGVTSAAFFSIAGSSIAKVQPHFDPAMLVAIATIWFVVEAGLVLMYSLKGIRGEVAKPIGLEAPGMVFPMALLKRYEAEQYYERLRDLSVDDVLRDYSAEIIKTSNIYAVKFHQVDDAVKALFRSMIPWLLGILGTVLLRTM
jgi:hypothetical protein